jgi:hypothetical protein
MDNTGNNNDSLINLKNGSSIDVSVGSMEVVAFPNPSQNYFNLKIKSSSNADVVVKVFDLTGKLVQELRGPVGQIFRFGDRLVAATYVVEVFQGDQRATVKVIKQ